MTPRIPRVVPWSSSEEYDQVAQWLFSADPQERQRAVYRIRAWSSRGKVPHAVECTATLVELGLLVDQCSLSNPMTSSVSPKELRLMLSMALIRFVNGFVDAQQQGIYALSVATLADQLGMPSWFVELRHAGTHEQLPSLSILRTTCGQALHWLYNSYWSVQRSNLQETMNELRPLLLEYKTYRKKSLKANKVSKQRFGVKVDRLLQSIVGHIDMNTFEDTLIPILLEPGCLVPMGKTKRATLPEVQLTEEICQIWTMALGHFNHIWYNANFLEVLTQAMLYQLYDTADNAAIPSTTADPSKPKSVSYTWTLVAWIKLFIEQYYCNEETYSSLTLQNLDDLLEYCLRHPNQYTLHILQFMTKWDDYLATTMTPLLSYIKKSVEPVKITSGTLTTLSDEEMSDELRKLRGLLKNSSDESFPSLSDPTTQITTDRTTLASDSPWTLQEDWTSCPIGSLPNQNRLIDLSLSTMMES